QQGFQQSLKFKVGLANGAEQISAAVVTPARHVFAHTGGKKPLSRFVKPDARAFLNQHADFTQFVFSQTHWVALAVLIPHSSTSELSAWPVGSSGCLLQTRRER